tara:strand:- start:6602 stop:7084 length:483 start_codon:yes stop_codon:yes gene_type:complete
VHNREPGRHTAIAQFQLAVFYHLGNGTVINHSEALKWCTLAAGSGWVGAIAMFGCMHMTGSGVPKDIVKGIFFVQCAAERGYTKAIRSLESMPTTRLLTPAVGTRARLILLASTEYNNKSGVVVSGAVGAGRVAVLLDNQTKPVALKIMNLKLATYINPF